jgi:hypothetical protein
MRRLRTTLLLLPLLILFYADVAASVLPIEVSHPVVPFLRRLEEKGLIAPGFWSTLPRDQSEVAAALILAEEKSRAPGAELSAWDRRKLERFLNTFDPERRKRTTRLHRETPQLMLHGEVEFFTGIYTTDSIPRRHTYALGSLTPRVEALFLEHGYFTLAPTVAMERSVNREYAFEYDPQNGMPHNTARLDGGWAHDATTFDGFRAIMGYQHSLFHIEAGQDWNQWGPGRWQHSTLGARPFFWVSDSLPSSEDYGNPNSPTGYEGISPINRRAVRHGYRYPGESAPLQQIRFSVHGKDWEYVKIVAKRKGLDTDSAASLVAHRLQLRIGALNLGFTEMLAIGTREINPILLLPGIPLKISEHDAGDQDNSMLSLDAEYTIRGHGRVYGEFLLDDFSGPPMSYWGNKLAWMLGGSWQDPLGLPAELHVEYAHVDPWVYGHRRYNTAMQHYGALLGSALPPNARAVYLEALFPLPLHSEGAVEYQFRQRDLRSPGSSIFDDTPTGSAEYDKAFLEKDVETRHAVGFSSSWQWNRYALLKLGAGGLWVTNFRGVPGESVATPTFAGEITLRY